MAPWVRAVVELRGGRGASDEVRAGASEEVRDGSVLVER